mgnify:CR=1 FL=1
MQTELQIKQQLAQQKFEFDMQLKQADVGKDKEKEQFIEDRKDNRTKLQATQQSQMIDQRQNDLAPTNFEEPPEEEQEIGSAFKM